MGCEAFDAYHSRLRLVVGRGRPDCWIALLVNFLGLLLTGDLPLAILSILPYQLHVDTAGIFGQMLTFLLITARLAHSAGDEYFLSMGVSAHHARYGRLHRPT